MKHPIGSYPPRPCPGRRSRQVISQAGSVLLVETVRKTGLDQAISQALAPWRKPRAVHDPGKAFLDVALAVALGGDCLADVAMLRCEPAVFGPVASDPTISRLIETLAASGENALQAIRSARPEVRQRAWSLAGKNAPDADGQVLIDLDGVLVIAHSDKEDAAPTWKKTYGHHPLTAFLDGCDRDDGRHAAGCVAADGHGGGNTTVRIGPRGPEPAALLRHPALNTVEIPLAEDLATLVGTRRRIAGAETSWRGFERG